ncbi:VOC family protein [Paramicrobacterium agarici]|uniref:VOC family protein n=1 Tax=Paramicrobacterium agarici TaxID=630514 RepID=UPI001172B0D3|nr:VOC family protein [Microbacterium agarici]TQO23382.1 catechol 2,3-dioxygenase [Microbacterium agarici]
MTATLDTSGKLAADTAMGPVTLLVADLDRMTAYYRDAVSLHVMSQSDNSTTLGRGGTPVVILEHAPELKHAASGSAGLFHTAILFESQSALAAALYSVARAQPETFTGSADHLVSQAFYFTDPEGNGVELYWDRDRTEWSWVHGQVEMATLYLDPNQYLREHLTDQGATTPDAVELGGAVVGHVHLSVGDTETARAFYVDTLGFDATASLGNQALFVSAGGYHHHMAMNVWNSRGAGPRMPALGLGRIDIELPARDGVGELDERLRHHKVQTRDDGRSLSFDDPWNNLITVTAAA